MRFGMLFAALIAASAAAPAIAGECQPDQVRVVIGLSSGPDVGPQAVSFCRREDRAAFVEYDVGAVPGFTGCVVVEFINFHLECNKRKVSEEMATTAHRSLVVAFTRDGNNRGAEWNKAGNLAMSVAQQEK